MRKVNEKLFLFAESSELGYLLERDFFERDFLERDFFERDFLERDFLDFPNFKFWFSTDSFSTFLLNDFNIL